MGSNISGPSICFLLQFVLIHTLATFRGHPFIMFVKFSAFLNPLPPLVRIFTQPISTIVRIIGHFSQPPPTPPWCERNKWIAPYNKLEDIFLKVVGNREREGRAELALKGCISGLQSRRLDSYDRT